MLRATPYATVSYGPLLFALPIADTHGANTPDPAAKWQYALDAQGEKLEDGIVVERQAMPAKWDWPLASPLKLRANGVAIDWNPAPRHPSAVGTSREKRAVGTNYAGAFRLHQVPRFDVPNHGTGSQSVAVEEVASTFGEVRGRLSPA